MHLSMWCIPERRGSGQALRARVASAELGGRGGAAALGLGGAGFQRGGNASLGARGGARGGAAKQPGAGAGVALGAIPVDDVAMFGVPGRSRGMHGAGGGAAGAGPAPRVASGRAGAGGERGAPRGGGTAAGGGGGGGGGFAPPREHAGAGAGAGRGGQHTRHDSQDRGLDDILSMP